MYKKYDDTADQFINWIIYIATSEAEDRLQEEFGYTNDNMRGLPYFFGQNRMKYSSLSISHLRG